jgi:hypothetical protein
MSNYEYIDSMLNEIRQAKSTPSNQVASQHPPIVASTMDPDGQERTASLIRASLIADDLEKQASMGGPYSEFLHTFSNAMRAKVASSLQETEKLASCGCGCEDLDMLSLAVKLSGVKKEYQNPEGGLNAKGRAHFKRTEGANLKRPVSAKQAKKSPKSAGRRKSFCSRMGGMKKKHNIDCSKTPDKDICKALRKWDC